jgi:hypothetical protein
MRILFDSFTMRRFWEYDKTLLQTQAHENLGCVRASLDAISFKVSSGFAGGTSKTAST